MQQLLFALVVSVCPAHEIPVLLVRILKAPRLLQIWNMLNTSKAA